MSSPVVSNPQASKVPPPKPDILPTLFGEGYGIYEVRKGSFVISFLLNTLCVAALIAAGSWVAANPGKVAKNVELLMTDISPVILSPAPDVAGGGGGGGDRDKLESPKGALPKQSLQQITPPAVVVRNENPKLEVDPTVLVPPEIKLPNVGPMGDPLANLVGPASNGTGSGSGIGSGSGGGVGSGRGPGFGPGVGGGTGGGIFRVGGGVSAPRPTYMPDPEYSEEARKIKFQGSVVLWIVVGPDGRTHDVRIVRSAGLGLDEKAIEAVRKWRFEPAKKDGQPVAVQVNVEVNFRLY